MDHDTSLSPAQQRAAFAFARAILPDRGYFPPAGEHSVAAALGMLADPTSGVAKAIGSLFLTLDAAAIPYTGRRFSKLSADKQEKLLQRWEQDRLLRRPLWLANFLFKTSHFDQPSVYEAAGCPWEKGGPPEPARWLQQVMAADQLTDGEVLECDAVVMGTGASGAVVAKELASRGYAVVIIEEGQHHRRDSFKGTCLDAKRRFYRGKARISTVGNALIPTFMGRLVGGSTAINTGTCYRTPDWILDEWCKELGTDVLSPDNMQPHFENVERTIGVEPVKQELWGKAAEVIARGCDRLGWHHAPMRRNAPDCDAQGACDFGCPSAARRSMDLTYIPAALKHNAVLIPSMRGHRVIIEGGRAVGLEARGVDTGATLRIRARAVVLAGGAVPTPLFLLGQGICNGSGQVGRNLSIHPATSFAAMFDEPINGHESIPQTIYSNQFLREGIVHNAASTPLSLTPLLIPMTGRRLMDTAKRFNHVANLGVMIKDETRGRVRLGPAGAPLLTYWLTKGEVAKMHQGLVNAAEMYTAAGAKQLYPLLGRFVVLDASPAGVEKLRRMSIPAWDFLLTSFHPLGTCRMGRDPASSVVGFDHESHEVPGLFIVDGSTVPGPPIVNPQITIMAMADRAGALIADKLQ